MSLIYSILYSSSHIVPLTKSDTLKFFDINESKNNLFL